MWKAYCPHFIGVSMQIVPGTVTGDNKGSETRLKSPPQEAHLLGQTLERGVG